MADPAEQDNPEGVDDGRPDWLPENFKTPEDFRDSYKEAQRKITEETNARKNLEAAYMELQEQVEALQAPPPPDTSNVQDQLYAMYENDPIGTMALLANQASQNALTQFQQAQQQTTQPQVAAQQEVVAAYADRELRNTIPDWDDYRGKVASYIQEHPWVIREEATLSPLELTGQLQEVYKTVKFNDLDSGEGKTSLDLAAMKQQAQSLQAGGARPSSPDDEKAAWERIRNAGDTSYWKKLNT